MSRFLSFTFIIGLMLTVMSPTAKAQLSAANAFASAPATIFPLLDKSTRLDMLDYFNASLSNESTNALNGKSRITALTAESATIKMTDASTVQIFILPTAAGDSIVGIITTVATPGHDSSLTLYARNWTKLNDRFKAPKLTDWIIDKKNTAEVEFVIPFMLTGYTYDPTTATLTLTNNLENFLSKDIYSTVAPLMRQQLVYRWTGRRFDPVK